MEDDVLISILLVALIDVFIVLWMRGLLQEFNEKFTHLEQDSASFVVDIADRAKKEQVDNMEKRIEKLEENLTALRQKLGECADKASVPGQSSAISPASTASQPQSISSTTGPDVSAAAEESPKMTGFVGVSGPNAGNSGAKPPKKDTADRDANAEATN